MASQQVLKIYIPRILGNVGRKRLIDTFDQRGIGKVFYLDMYSKKNENNNLYSFAFLNIKMYTGKSAKDLMHELNSNGYTRLNYDSNPKLYWEIKPHVDRLCRSPKSVSSRSTSPDSLQATSPVTIQATSPDKICALKPTAIPFKPQKNISEDFRNASVRSRANTVTSVEEVFERPVNSISNQDRLDLIDEFNEIEKELFDIERLDYNDDTDSIVTQPSDNYYELWTGKYTPFSASYNL